MYQVVGRTGKRTAVQTPEVTVRTVCLPIYLFACVRESLEKLSGTHAWTRLG